jgi:hypothetical protein
MSGLFQGGCQGNRLNRTYCGMPAELSVGNDTKRIARYLVHVICRYLNGGTEENNQESVRLGQCPGRDANQGRPDYKLPNRSVEVVGISFKSTVDSDVTQLAYFNHLKTEGNLNCI